jgi:Dynein light chain type 1
VVREKAPKQSTLFPIGNARQMAERKAVIKNADMSEDMQQDAVDCASQALEKYNIEKVRIALLPQKSFFKRHDFPSRTRRDESTK